MASPKKDIRLANKHMKICLTSLTLRKCTLKAQGTTYISTRTAKVKNTDKYQLLERIQKNWNSHTLMAEMHNGTATLENGLAVSNKGKYTLKIRCRDCTLGHLLKINENLCSNKGLYTYIHSSI